MSTRINGRINDSYPGNQSNRLNTATSSALSERETLLAQSSGDKASRNDPSRDTFTRSGESSGVRVLQERGSNTETASKTAQKGDPKQSTADIAHTIALTEGKAPANGSATKKSSPNGMPSLKEVIDALPKKLESPGFFAKLRDLFLEIFTFSFLDTRTFDNKVNKKIDNKVIIERAIPDGQDVLDDLVKKLGEKRFESFFANPEKAGPFFEEAVRRANPKLDKSETQELVWEMMLHCTAFEQARPWATPADGNAFGLLGKNMKEDLKCRLSPGEYNKLTPPQRLNLVILYSKLKSEGLWSEVGKITWVGNNGAINFIPNSTEAGFFNALNDHGYGDTIFANNNGNKWGVRSPKLGCELHFRFGGPELTDKKTGIEKAEAHIDLHNPGKGLKNLIAAGPWHSYYDGTFRNFTHRVDFMLQALEKSGVKVEVPCPS